MDRFAKPGILPRFAGISMCLERFCQPPKAGFAPRPDLPIIEQCARSGQCRLTYRWPFAQGSAHAPP
jgi:hypothetical protein